MLAALSASAICKGEKKKEIKMPRVRCWLPDVYDDIRSGLGLPGQGRTAGGLIR